VNDGSLPTGAFVDPTRSFTFQFEGRTIPALAGQSIGAALYAAGQRIFTRSFKYHRPRGLFCVSGDCPNCLMNVDGRTNVRTCVEPARPEQKVTHQNAWPSLEFDCLRLFDTFSRHLPVGFYYKRFHRPRWMWPIFEHTVRHIAGLGRVDIHHAAHDQGAMEYVHADVCVIGGGRAGMTEALRAAEDGGQVVLLERLPQLGGRTLLVAYAGDDELTRKCRSHANIRVCLETTAFGLYEGNLIAAFSGNTLLKIRAGRIVVCTGGRQQPFVLANNDLPGVFPGDGVLRLARLYGVPAGQRAVVLTDSDEGQALALQLQQIGISVAAVVDQRPAAEPGHKTDWPMYLANTVLSATARARLISVLIQDSKSGQSQEIHCDLLCMAGRRQPAVELLLQAGVRFRHEDGCWKIDKEVPGISWGKSPSRQPLSLGERGYDSLPSPPGTGVGGEGEATSKYFVCLCEDVTEKDLHQAVAEGFDEIETLKRYSTANMGPCQGKMCGQNVVEICARLTNRPVGAVGTTTSRPPVVPVELATLAAAHAHHPVRRTPLHHWHEASSAVFMDAGLWKRPESYCGPAEEVRSVRSSLGMIDVSTLGKFEIVGPDAVELLERIYLNRWSDLRPGRARYGAMCNEDGILIDDGVAGRLATDRFYMTATTGNADAIFQWLELWKATWRLDVTLIDRTSAMAAMNLAGPHAREVLAALADFDVSGKSFPYMGFREGRVAGVPCRVLRIGFVGELGYEIHCPNACARPVWEALMDEGKKFAIRPFGVEAQRILRLEKGHILIGQDTDALSNPLEAGLEWMVRFDKAAFIGKEPLLRLQEMGPRSRLVGFTMLDDARVLPEGSQVVDDGRPVGRITSTRYSPTLGKSIGLAWVPRERARVGYRFEIRWNGMDVPATVVPLPFYDPDGIRLKSC
jgi:sarcosine oxidase subunit alpha